MARRREAELSYEGVRRNCTAANGYSTEIATDFGPLVCHFKNRRQSAHIDFALEKVPYRIDLQKWTDVTKAHAAYVKENFPKDEWKEMLGKFSDDGFKFDVRREDAEEWFERVHGKLARKEGLTGIVMRETGVLEKPWVMDR